MKSLSLAAKVVHVSKNGYTEVRLELDDDRADLNHFSFKLRKADFPFIEGENIHVTIEGAD